ncbi:hypothetical protein [Alishewanella phage vB_AspM_Slickus01]|nr:hypothetical protein [Alishewanella phage vB_AspM_Slickus01]
MIREIKQYPFLKQNVADDVVVFNIIIFYKNGLTAKYWFTELDYSDSSIKYSTITTYIRPLKIGIDEIMSMHQIGALTVGELKERIINGEMEIFNVI